MSIEARRRAAEEVRELARAAMAVLEARDEDGVGKAVERLGAALLPFGWAFDEDGDRVIARGQESAVSAAEAATEQRVYEECAREFRELAARTQAGDAREAYTYCARWVLARARAARAQEKR